MMQAASAQGLGPFALEYRLAYDVAVAYCRDKPDQARRDRPVRTFLCPGGTELPPISAIFIAVIVLETNLRASPRSVLIIIASLLVIVTADPPIATEPLVILFVV